MDRMSLPDFETASTIALKALTFLATDASQMEHFMGLTGIGIDALQSQAGEPHMMASVLAHFCQDESLLLTFAANSGLDPGLIEPALHVLQNA